MDTVFRVARKEFAAFFASPAAFLFLGAFLAVSLFVFFWVETFFAANIAEVRPLFKWMPILLIFLTAAITMRLWAEERRAGTLEFLLTSPVKPVALVAGKFFGCLGLVLLSLALTLPLPLTVSFLGPLDWGPVWGGYLASVFLAAAYIAIGLYVSVRSENQIVSLIITVLVCSFFYLLGSDLLTSLMGTQAGGLFKLLGTGSRFESITRGVIDFRDLYYYLAIVGVFLSLNVLGLEKIRWAGNPANGEHRRWRLLTGVLVANFIVAGVWLAPVTSLRADLTRGDIYSISEATRGYLAQLKEPLLIRGYFSDQTHPLLAPLVPRLQDLLREYEVAGGDQVNVEFVNPLDHPELEQEAGQKYGIRPVPFQTTSKYQASVTNSYFDILIRYGDQHETLGFRDLIEVKLTSENDMEVELRNPEYDITRAIRKTLFGYQGGGNLFAEIGRPVKLAAYISAPSALPEVLVELEEQLENLLADIKQEGGELFSYEIIDPEAAGLEAELEKRYGFQPMAASLFDQRTFWFYMVLESGGQHVEVPLPEDLDGEGLKRTLEAGLKRFAAGFTKTIAIHTQKATPPMPQYGIGAQGKQFSLLKESLRREHALVETDLEEGVVPAQADILLLVSPENLSEKQLFAVDQFLMRGGTVILATSPYDIAMDRELSLVRLDSGLEDWLTSHGIEIASELVLDAQNSPFPIPIQRDVGGFTVQEMKMIDYPFFVDIRADGMNDDSPLLQGMDQLTMQWASPVRLGEQTEKSYEVTRLLYSSENSWLTTELEVQPDFENFPRLGFAAGEEAGRQPLAVSVRGSFSSFFGDRPSPLLREDEEDEEGPPAQAAGRENAQQQQQKIGRVITRSPETAGIICFASNTFLADAILTLGSGVRRTGYLEPVQMIANAVDASLEDSGLLQIRGRSHFSRPLAPLDRRGQLFFEYLNYGLALAALICVWALHGVLRRKRAAHERALLSGRGR